MLFVVNLLLDLYEYENNNTHKQYKALMADTHPANVIIWAGLVR